MTHDAAPTLAELLAGYRVEALRAMAARAMPSSKSADKGALVQRLATSLACPENAVRAMEALDDRAVGVLRRVRRIDGIVDWLTLVALLHDDGLVEPPPVMHQYGAWSSRGTPGQPGDKRSRAFQDVISRLEIAGLVLGVAPRGSASVIDFGLAAGYVVPREIASALPPVPARRGSAPNVDRVESGDAVAWARDLYLVWTYVWLRRPALLATTGQMSKRDMARLAQQLPHRIDLKAARREEDIPVIFRARNLLQDLGLMSCDATLEAHEDAAREHWSLPLERRMAAALQALLGARWWNELRHLPDVTWRPTYSDDAVQTPDAVLRARWLVLECARSMAGDGDWVSLDWLLAEIRGRHPALLVSGAPSAPVYGHERDKPGLTLHSAAGNAQGWSFHNRVDALADSWLAERRFAVLVLTMLRQLGLADFGLDAEGAERAFRLTALGRRVLCGADVEISAADEGARVVVQPNFHVVAFGPVSEIVLMELERIADRVSSDRVFEYEITRQSFYRGQQLGRDAARVDAWLREVTGEALPQNVARTLAQWQESHERIVVTVGASLVQSAEPDTLEKLAAAADGAVKLLAPTWGLIRSRPGFEKAVAQVGLVPAANHGAGNRPGARLDDDGTVRFRHRVPEMYLLGRVQRLAEWDEGGAVWRLTSTSVRRARSVHGLDAPAQIRLWRSALVDEPPEWLDRRVKAWSRHYGAARLHRPVLLELPDAEALRDAREQPELRDLLAPFAAAGALVTVDPDDLEIVAALLRELGIDIEDA